MTLPNLTGLTPADIAEFDAIVDQIPFGYAKHLASWMNRMIAGQAERDKQLASDLDDLTRQLEAEPPATQSRSQRIDQYVEEIAESCASPPAPETIH
jgi:hypothetical protein